MAPLRLKVQPPAWDDFSSGEDSDQEDDERPLTREELKRKTLRGGGTVSGVGGGGGGGPACAAGTRGGGGGGGSGGPAAAGNKPKDGKVRERRVRISVQESGRANPPHTRRFPLPHPTFINRYFGTCGARDGRS